MVPVVLKKSIYKDILPPGSYIAADDFTSPRELAQYLTRLANNETAYLRYSYLLSYYNSKIFTEKKIVVY